MKKLFMAVIALMMTLSASAQFFIYFSDGTVAKVDSISMLAPFQDNDSPLQGIGTFSVSSDKQVTFSKGNLQYTQSTNTWSFADNQYDMLGEANMAIDTNILADKIDLFGWSTASTYFGVSNSVDYNDYSGPFVDWGTNKIGNDAPNTWRTLTRTEWDYLLNSRNNASSLCGVAQVNGVNGLIFLPDNWVCPADVTFKSGFHSKGGRVYFADYQIFTAEQWSKLEAAGAVFLPAAGSRNYIGEGKLEVKQINGHYWSASNQYSEYAYMFQLCSSGASLYFGSYRYAGLSVRLVKDL